MDLSQPMGEPRGPAMLVPVRVFLRGEHHWTLDFAARCQVCHVDRLGLSTVRIEAARVAAGVGAFVNLSGVLRELEQSARFLSLLLRDGWSARDLCHRLSPHIGEHGIHLAGAMGFCGSASGALLLAAEHAEVTIQTSAARELQAAGVLSEMG